MTDDLLRRISELEGRLRVAEEDKTKLRAALKLTWPIARATYLDERNAFAIPGSGYTHKGQHLASRTWSIRGREFDAVEAQMNALIKGP
jgi:hypothetical protein